MHKDFMLKKTIITIFLFFSTLYYPIIVCAKEDLTLDPKLSQLLDEISCITCQGQTILGSQSEFAGIIKHFVEIRFREGKNSNQIKDELISIYGAQIILTPKFNIQTAFLWLSPMFFVMMISLTILLKKMV